MIRLNRPTAPTFLIINPSNVLRPTEPLASSVSTLLHRSTFRFPRVQRPYRASTSVRTYVRVYVLTSRGAEGLNFKVAQGKVVSSFHWRILAEKESAEMKGDLRWKQQPHWLSQTRLELRGLTTPHNEKVRRFSAKETIRSELEYPDATSRSERAFPRLDKYDSVRSRSRKNDRQSWRLIAE